MKTICSFCLMLVPFLSNALTDALKLRLSGNAYYDEVVVRFDPSGSVHYNSNLDAWKMFSPNPSVGQLYMNCDPGQSLSIYALPTTSLDTTIDLYTLIGLTGTYTLTATELGTFPAGTCIVLEDLNTGTYSDLTTGNTYTFQLLLNSLTSGPSFRIHFKPAPSVQSKAASCFGQVDGGMIISGAGWAYSLQNSVHQVIHASMTQATADTTGNLASGAYYIALNNTLGCSLMDTLAISQPLQIVPEFLVSDTALDLAVSGSVTLTNTSMNASSYSWTYGDLTQGSVSTNTQHTYTAAGTYVVSLKAIQGGCAAIATRQITVSGSPMGIVNTPEQSGLHMFIGGEKILVQKTGGEVFPMLLAIYNLRGQELQTMSGTASSSYEIPTGNLPQGELIVRVISGGSSLSKKVLLVHTN